MSWLAIHSGSRSGLSVWLEPRNRIVKGFPISRCSEMHESAEAKDLVNLMHPTGPQARTTLRSLLGWSDEHPSYFSLSMPLIQSTRIASSFFISGAIFACI